MREGILDRRPYRYSSDAPASCLERGDNGRVELALNGLRQTQPSDPTRHRMPVRPVRRHGVVGVRNSDHSGEEGNPVTTKRVRIAETVKTLMVMTDDRSDLLIVVDILQDPLADYRMLLHLTALVERECTGLFQEACS